MRKIQFSLVSLAVSSMILAHSTATQNVSTTSILPFKGGNDSVKPSFQGVRYLIGLFIGKLASLASGDFSHIDFEEVKAYLEIELAFLESLAPKVNPYSEELTRRLMFAKYLYQAIASSSEIFKEINDKSSGGFRWIKLVLQLNLEILVTSISKSYEHLDSLGKYVNSVDFHSKHLKFWTDVFKYMNSVTLSIRLQFINQVEMADLFLKEWFKPKAHG